MTSSTEKFAIVFHTFLGIGIILGAVDYILILNHKNAFINFRNINFEMAQDPRVSPEVAVRIEKSVIQNGTMKQSSMGNDTYRKTENLVSFEPTAKTSPEVTIAGKSYSYYNQSEYFFSVSEIKRLAQIEQKLVPIMYKVWKRLNGLKASINRNNRVKLSRYLRDYERSVFASKTKLKEQKQNTFAYSPPTEFGTEKFLKNATKLISLHPLKVFRLLRRLYFDFPRVLGDLKRHNDLVAISKKINPPINLEDLDGAADGILRIQETYNISTIALSNGKLMGLETYSGLSALDVHYIGKRGLGTKRFTQGILWLHEAYRMTTKENDDSVKPGVVKADLVNGIHLHNSYMTYPEHNEYTFPYVLSSDLEQLDTPERLQKSLGFGSFKTAEKNEFDTNSFHALCRGKNIRGPQFTKTLKCWYKRDNPWLLIKPLKVEMHNDVVGLVQFYDILPNQVIRHLKDEGVMQLKRAGVLSLTKNKKALLSYGRVSNSAWINDSSIGLTAASIFSKIPKLIKEAVGLDAETGIAAEQSQLSCYGPIGGFYDTHFDSYYEKAGDYRNLTTQEMFIGDRIATIMFYLNDLKIGGGTAFPRLGVVTQPIKGSALFWFNLRKNGDANGNMLHGGCPVLYGEKCVVNKWIRAGSQMFLKKCSENRYE